MPHRVTGEVPGLGQVTGAWGQLRLEPLLAFLQERSDRVNSLRLSSLNNFHEV